MIALASVRKKGTEMKADPDDLSQVRNVEGSDEMSEVEIDDNLEDTFPASDPPSWTLGSDHRPADNQEREDDVG